MKRNVNDFTFTDVTSTKKLRLSNRADSYGLCWQDVTEVKDAKEQQEKRQPPEPIWLNRDYLPGYEEALRFDVAMMSHEEMWDTHFRKIPVVFDIECYPNYFLISFRSITTGNAIVLEQSEYTSLDPKKLIWALEHFILVGFNSLRYDIIIANLAACGCTMMQLYEATDDLIVKEMWGSNVYRKFKCQPYKTDHIDLIEVAPLTANLKIYGARLHSPRVQDLPFPPGTWLTKEQQVCVRWYNIQSDLTATAFLFMCLKPHIDLRADMSNRYKIDLRSKSDAQIAEAVIKNEYKNRTGIRATVPKIDAGRSFRFRIPHYIRFRHPALVEMLHNLQETDFVISESGKVGLPEILREPIDIGQTSYQMGIGGLHSREKSVAWQETNTYEIVDKDVTSFYPYLMLNQRLFPPNLGEVFVDIFEGIVKDRVAAKAAKKKVIANSLKIVVNGTFGKFSDPFSIMYSPENTIQVTVSGQLCLLMLIEWLESEGFSVISANTDGVVTKVDRQRRQLYDAIVAAWEKATGLQTEETKYRALYSRDVNNYIAVKHDGTTKNKGAFANPWYKCEDSAEKLHKNPVATICIEAAVKKIVEGIDIEATIRGCTDITKFVVVRTAKGGAVKLWDGQQHQFLGKSLRWYYSKDAHGDMVIASNGNFVPDAENAMPCSDLPAQFPSDVNYEMYIEKTEKILKTLAYYG